MLEAGNRNPLPTSEAKPMDATTAPHFSARDFRNALGNFATGIAIVTTRDADGQPVGCTINSFASVSLEPPLISFCLDRKAGTFTAFQTHSHFALHFLAANQEELSRRFAKAGEDRFGDLQPIRGLGDVPVLPGCLAHFECSVFDRIDAGDHVLILGQVEKLQAGSDLPPLLYFRGRYAHLTPESD
ncbi:MAG: flavin reductase family protein [Elstera sp.]